MCLAIPMRISDIQGESGTAEVRGVSRRIDLSLVQPASVGDYVLVHTGFALQRIDEEEYHRTLAILQELGEGLEEGDEAATREEMDDREPRFFRPG